MAQNAVTSGAGPARVGPFAGPPVRLSWGAIFGGTVAALGVGILLHALGFALGLTAIDPNDPGTFRASSIFTGIWSLVTSIIALFVGGMVASRGSGAMTRSGAAIHGLVMWGFTTLAATWLLLNVAANLIGGVASVGKAAVQAGAGAVAGAASGAQQADLGRIAETLGIDADAALSPVNARLRAQGLPEITADELLAASRGVLQQAVRDGRIDRNMLIEAISANTTLSRADADEVAARLQVQLEAARGRASEVMSQTARDVQTGALAAAEDTGKAFWGLFGALLLGMLSAVAGATVGVSKRQRLWASPVAPDGSAAPEAFGAHARTNP
jgi:hypothetical protein